MHARAAAIWVTASALALAAVGARADAPPSPHVAPTRRAAPCQAAPSGMACVPGGWFLRGSDRGPKNARPQARVWVDTFYMDKTEVTVAAYDACVAAGDCSEARTVYEDFSRPKQPKVGVSWFDAVKFCRARGKHLPTEAEWEKAARGSDGRLYPWGAERATCERAVIEDHRGRSCGVKKQGREPHKGRTFEVASRPANPFGLFDMSGNAWEWVFDWYSNSYASCGARCTEDNPRGPCGGADRCPGHFDRVVRGGSWYYGAELATTIHRRPHAPSNRPYHHFGFRCAATGDEQRALGTRSPSGY